MQGSRWPLAIVLSAIILFPVMAVAETQPVSIRGTLTDKNINKFANFLDRTHESAEICLDLKVKLGEEVGDSALGEDRPFAAFVSDPLKLKTPELRIIIDGEETNRMRRSIFHFVTRAFVERDGYARMVGLFKTAMGKCHADCVLFWMNQKSKTCLSEPRKGSTLFLAG